MLPQRMGQQNQQLGTDNKLLAQVMRNPDMYDNIPSREQVFTKALTLETDIKKLD